MKDDVVVPVLGSAVGLLGAILIAIALLWIIKSRRKVIAQKSRSVLAEMKLRRFSYDELVKMTDNFQRRIAQGGFANVYHGQLDDAPVAVKLYRNHHRSSAAAEFQTEVNHLNKIYHKSLIKVVGYYEGSTKSAALVFELMANGDLKKNLTGSGSTKLTWERRLGIAIDMAKALDYLHDGCQPPIIHRDFNSSNILLSENFDQVKLSGFSLAVSLIPSHDGESHVSITIAGTFGYMDPQYAMTGKLTIGTDVYGFGVVLMEIITGKPSAIIQIDGEGVCLTQWVSSMFANGEIERIMDPRLEGNFDVYSLEEALKVAFDCVSHNSNDRPTMGEVVLKLKHCLQMETARFNQTIFVS